LLQVAILFRQALAKHLVFLFACAPDFLGTGGIAP
jgi:hypothetical protein